MSRLHLLITKFGSDQSGSVVLLFGMGCVCFLVIAGLAIDTGRYYNLASKIQASLDAATLAGAKHLGDDDMTDADITALTRSYFNSAILSLGVKPASIDQLQVVIDRSTSSVESTSHLLVPSLFGPLISLPRYVNLERTSKVVYQMNRIELAMVLDITGSMNVNNKINDLKSAANDVIDQLFQGALNEQSVRIAVAPYSASVNAGALANSVSSGAPGTNDDSCAIERLGPNADTDASPTGSDQLGKVTSLPYGSYSCPDATVIPLLGRSEAAMIKDTIGSYQAGGSTAGHIGTSWGWYLLSPSWASVLPSASVPAPYGEKNLTKAMLIMTDGLFNTSYVSGPHTDPAAQVEESYTHFQSLCDGAKAKGISIYTVGFDLNDARALDELKGCASSPTNFFDAKSGADLKAAFKAVADKLNTLRVAS